MCVAPNWIAVAKSALMPMDKFFNPLRAAILAVSAKVRRRRLVDRRDAHQAEMARP